VGPDVTNNPNQYTSRENDGTGLYFYRARYYDAVLKQFISSDPIGVAGGLNTYAYTDANPLMYTDPLGLWAVGDSLPQGVVDFSAGMGDTLLFGQGQRLRDALGIDGGVDQCSNDYDNGEWAGIAGSLATGLAGGLRAAGAKGAGKEFSHWIPNRMGGPRSVWNGNFVPTATHALSDPYRYRFMPKAWKTRNPMPNVASQQWTRIPNVYKGAAVGAAYGAAGAAQSGCTCSR
jgi:RHS repeat-associated protein